MSDGASFSAMAIFCEDGRDEIGGTLSLIGIMPDNVAVTAFPATLPRLHVYVRISFDPTHPPATVSTGVRVNDEAPVLVHHYDADMLHRTIAAARTASTRIGTMIARFGAANVEIREPCLLNATITWDGEEYIIGALAIKAAA